MNPERFDALLNELQAIHPDGDVEDVLVTGYATALELEVERHLAAKRLDSLVGEAAGTRETIMTLDSQLQALRARLGDASRRFGRRSAEPFEVRGDAA